MNNPDVMVRTKVPEIDDHLQLSMPVAMGAVVFHFNNGHCVLVQLAEEDNGEILARCRVSSPISLFIEMCDENEILEVVGQTQEETVELLKWVATGAGKNEESEVTTESTTEETEERTND